MKKKDIFLIILRCVIALTLFAVAIIYYDELSNIDVRALADVTDKLVVLIAMILAVYVIKALVFVVPASVVYVAVGAIPAFPIDFVSLFYGASGCKYLKYAVLSVAGIAWRVILFTLLGDAIFKWIPLDKIILIAICCIPIGVVYYLIKKFRIEPKKAQENKTDGCE